jgi:hypothetical protein
LRAASPFATHAERLPFLLSLNAQCTLMEPAAGLYADLSALEAQGGVFLSFAMGFPAADFPECGPVVFGHGHDADAVRDNVKALAENTIAQRADWAAELLAPRDAVARAIGTAERAGKPVVIADTQDNPGAGEHRRFKRHPHGRWHCRAGHLTPISGPQSATGASAIAARLARPCTSGCSDDETAAAREAGSGRLRHRGTGR